MRALFLVFMVMASALSIKAAAVQWGHIYLNENGNLECAFPISSFSIYCEFASASDGSSAWSFTPLSSSILIDYPLFLLNWCWDSRFARKGEKNARETMAIVSRAVTTSPFTPRFGKPTHS